MHKLILILAAATCLVLPGCTQYQTGRYIEVTPAQQAQLIVGKTTKEELLQMFGPPQGVARGEDKEAWTWFHTSSGILGANLQVRTFTAVFDDDDTLYEYTNNAGSSL